MSSVVLLASPASCSRWSRLQYKGPGMPASMVHRLTPIKHQGFDGHRREACCPPVAQKLCTRYLSSIGQLHITTCSRAGHARVGRHNVSTNNASHFNKAATLQDDSDADSDTQNSSNTCLALDTQATRADQADPGSSTASADGLHLGQINPLKLLFGSAWRKAVPLSILFFSATFIFTMLQSLKDGIVVIEMGADALPYLTTLGTLPASLAYFNFYRFTLVPNVAPQHLYYATAAPFLVFYALFAFVLYPLAPVLQNPSWLAWLQVLPQGLAGLVAAVQKWLFSLFYVMGDLWGPVMITLAFWTVADEVCTMEEAQQLYPQLGLLANLGLVGSGKFIKAVHSAVGHSAGMGAVLQVLVVCMLAMSGVMFACKWVINRRYLRAGVAMAEPETHHKQAHKAHSSTAEHAPAQQQHQQQGEQQQGSDQQGVLVQQKQQELPSVTPVVAAAAGDDGQQQQQPAEQQVPDQPCVVLIQQQQGLPSAMPAAAADFEDETQPSVASTSAYVTSAGGNIVHSHHQHIKEQQQQQQRLQQRRHRHAAAFMPLHSHTNSRSSRPVDNCSGSTGRRTFSAAHLTMQEHQYDSNGVSAGSTSSSSSALKVPNPTAAAAAAATGTAAAVSAGLPKLTCSNRHTPQTSNSSSTTAPAAAAAGVVSSNSAKSSSRAKPKASWQEAWAVLGRNPKAMELTTWVVSFGVALRLFEYSFKSQLRLAAADSAAYCCALADLQSAVGMATLVLMMTSKLIFKHMGWSGAALISPSVMLLFGSIFFACCLLAQAVAAAPAAGAATTAAAAAAGAASLFGPLLSLLKGGVASAVSLLNPTQMTTTSPVVTSMAAAAAVPPLGGELSKVLSGFGLSAGFATCMAAGACRSSLFQPSKEMVYKTMTPAESKESKAVVDLIGGQVAKSGAGWLVQLLLLASGSINAALSAMAVLYITAGYSWLMSTLRLSHQMKGFEVQQQREAAAATSTQQQQQDEVDLQQDLELRRQQLEFWQHSWQQQRELRNQRLHLRRQQRNDRRQQRQRLRWLPLPCELAEAAAMASPWPGAATCSMVKSIAGTDTDDGSSGSGSDTGAVCHDSSGGRHAHPLLLQPPMLRDAEYWDSVYAALAEDPLLLETVVQGKGAVAAAAQQFATAQQQLPGLHSSEWHAHLAENRGELSADAAAHQQQLHVLQALHHVKPLPQVRGVALAKEALHTTFDVC